MFDLFVTAWVLILTSVWPALRVSVPKVDVPATNFSLITFWAVKAPCLSIIAFPLNILIKSARGEDWRNSVPIVSIVLHFEIDRVPSTDRSTAIVVLPKNVSPRDLKILETERS